MARITRTVECEKCQYKNKINAERQKRWRQQQKEKKCSDKKK